MTTMRPLCFTFAAFVALACSLGALRLFPSEATAQPKPGKGDVARGKAVYEKKCAVCHGVDGKGNGAAEFVLFPKPRDFTKGIFKIRSTTTLPSDSDLLVSRLVFGATPLVPHLRALSGSLSREHQFFLNVLKRLDPLLVPDFTNQTAGTMKLEFVETWNPTSGILAPLRVGTRPIGLIYYDRGTRNRPVLPQDYQTFLLFFTHTTLGMNHLAGVM